jgi:hypothetical protein
VLPVLDQLQTWQAMTVALLGAALWALPLHGRWPLWHHSIGLLLALATGAITAAVAGDVGALVEGALQGMLGLSVSWVLIEAIVLTRALATRIRRKVPTMNHDQHDPSDIDDGKPDDETEPKPTDDPPPLLPPPPVK